MTDGNRDRAARYCPHCGTANPAAARVCAGCQRALPTPEALAALWNPSAAPPSADTQPITAVPALRRDPPPVAPDAYPLAPAYVPSPPTPAARQRHRGPGGCLMTAFALLLIGAVAAALVWLLAVRPYVQDRAETELRRGVEAQVRQIEDLPVLPSGNLVVTEDQINRDLAAADSAGQYKPIENPRVRITPGRVAVSFDLYNLGSTYSGALTVEAGRLKVIDDELDGPAGQILNADDAAAVIEEQLGLLLDRSQLRATAVRIETGRLTIVTAPTSR